MQLPPIDNGLVSKLRTSNSFGDIAGEAERQKEKAQRKGNAFSKEQSPKIKELRSFSIAVPPNSFDPVSHLVSPLPTNKQFIHTDCIQRYDDEVTHVELYSTVLLSCPHIGSVIFKPVSNGGDNRTCELYLSYKTHIIIIVIIRALMV